MNNKQFPTKNEVRPNVLPVPVVTHIHPGSAPQAVALGIVDEYKRGQNAFPEGFQRFLYSVGVFNAKVHPTRRGYYVEFVYEGLHIETTVQYQCTYQVHTSKFSPRPR